MTGDALSRVFAALADPTRRDMVARLSEGDATVSQLAEPYRMSLQAVYKHLRVLEDAGLVSRSRGPQPRPVRLEVQALDLMDTWIERHRDRVEQRYRRLDTRRGHQPCSASSERSAARLSSSAVSWARSCFSSRLTCFSSVRACCSLRYRPPCRVLTRSSTSRRSSRSHGFPCIAAGRYWSLPASIAAKISSCVSPYSERAVLSLSVAPLRPHSSARNSIAGHYLPGRNSARPVFAGLPAHELAEAGTDHGDAGTGSRSEYQGFSLTQQGLAVLGPGETRLAQDLLEHCVGRLRVGGGQAAKRRRADRLRPQVPAQHLHVPLAGRENRGGEQVAQHPVLVIEVEPVGLVADDADGVRVGEFGRKLERGHVHAGDVRWPTAGGPPGERGFPAVPVEDVDPFLGLGGRK